MNVTTEMLDAGATEYDKWADKGCYECLEAVYLGMYKASCTATATEWAGVQAELRELEERYRKQLATVEKTEARADALLRALEIITVGDAQDPQAQAAEELIALGYWRDIPEARAVRGNK